MESTRVSEWLAPPRFSAHLWLGHVPSSWHVDIFMRCDQVSVLREPVASRMVRPRGCGTRCDQSRWSVIFMLYTGGHAGILAFFCICARRLQALRGGHSFPWRPQPRHAHAQCSGCVQRGRGILGKSCHPSLCVCAQLAQVVAACFLMFTLCARPPCRRHAVSSLNLSLTALLFSQLLGRIRTSSWLCGFIP